MDNRKDHDALGGGESAIGAGAGTLAGPLAGLDGSGIAAAAAAIGPVSGTSEDTEDPEGAGADEEKRI